MVDARRGHGWGGGGEEHEYRTPTNWHAQDI
jgi:hypothetical protein